MFAKGPWTKIIFFSEWTRCLWLAVWIAFACSSHVGLDSVDDRTDMASRSDSPHGDNLRLELKRPELGRWDGGLVDVRVECVPGQGAFGCPCHDNSDCTSDWCMLHLGEKVCSKTCVEDCPNGWLCEETAGTGTDKVFVCNSLFPTLCLPCETSEKCALAGGGRCVSYGEALGGFCGAECPTKGSCLPGYECQIATTVEQQEVKQCMLATGECSCSTYAVAKSMQTMCSNGNRFGVCQGWRQCTPSGLTACTAPVPAAEQCDGVDNDCDGETDEGAICVDDNQCTADACGAGKCVFTPVADDTECFDDDLCTDKERCVAGKCMSETVECDDDNPCTDDECLPKSGCHFPNNTSSTENDGNPCTLDECQGGEYVHLAWHEGEDCDDLDPCTLANECHEGHCAGTDFNYDDCSAPCGDGECKFPDSADSCPEDCGPCGDGLCGNHENGPNGGGCPKDCLTACGDGICEGGENLEFCLVDCGKCGDGFCGLNEGGGACPGDCPSSCGDGVCGQGESDSSCAPDCMSPCGDGICDWGENTFNCPTDCTICGDGLCGIAEDVEGCPMDCIVPCGNGVCEGGENPDKCAVDCGWCGDGVCGKNEQELGYCPMDCPIGCGDGICDAGESKKYCPVDCCVPTCIGKECGDDGCGGNCGGCATYCQLDHFCCEPACQGLECGDDGCGGSCGGCDDDLYCTDDVCQAGECAYQIQDFHCLIDVICVASGTKKPDNQCLQCQPEVSQDAWSAGADGIPCGTGKVCFEGGCCDHQSHCIGKECGNDDCGGECGMCAEGLLCAEALCVQCDDGNFEAWDGCTEGMISEFKVNGFAQGEQRWPAVAPMGNGEWLTVWHGYDLGGMYPSILGRRTEPGKGTTGPELQISTSNIGAPDKYASWGPSIATFAEGGFVVAWTTYDGNGNAQEVFAHTYTDNIEPIDDPFQLNVFAVNSQMQPRLAPLPAKRFIAAWTSMEQDGDEGGIFARLFEHTGQPVSGELQVNAPGIGSQSEADIVRLPDNRVLVTWAEFDSLGLAQDIWARFLTDEGAEGGEPFRLTENALVQESSPSVCPLTDGKFLAIWAATGPAQDGYPDGDGSGVFGRVFDVDGSPDGELFMVNSYKTGHQFQPRATALAGGNVAVAWSSQTLSQGNDVFFRILDAKGTPLTKEARANSFQGGDQWYPAVTSLPSAAFVVSWESAGQDGDKAGIFALRVDAMGNPLYF